MVEATNNMIQGIDRSEQYHRAERMAISNGMVRISLTISVILTARVNICEGLAVKKS